MNAEYDDDDDDEDYDDMNIENDSES